MATSRKRAPMPEDPPPPVDERSLPHNLDAERAVLGAILLNNAALMLIPSLRPAHFYRRVNQHIFEAMVTLLGRPHGAVDFVLLREELARVGVLEEVGAGYLASLVDGVPKSTNVAYYAGIVEAKARSRRLIQTLSKTIAAAYDGIDDVEEVLAQADREIVELRHGVRETPQAFRDRTSAVFADLERRVERRGILSGLPTGWEALNDLTDGWQPGDLIVVAARPSMGKTAFVVGSMLTMAETPRPDGTPRTLLMFSLEMRAKQIEQRVLANLSGVPFLRIQRGLLGPSGSADWTQLAEALDRFAHLNIIVDDTHGQTHQDIRAACRRQQASDDGLDGVVIDYVQLMRGSITKRAARRDEELADISRALKLMAGELGVPVMLLSQLRRTGGGKPKLEDLRESGALEQDADIALFLHRKKHTDGGLTELIVEKNRNGATGSVYLDFQREIVRFDAWTGPAEAVAEAAAEDAAAEKKARGRKFAQQRKQVTI